MYLFPNTEIINCHTWWLRTTEMDSLTRDRKTEIQVSAVLVPSWNLRENLKSVLFPNKFML
jgi:hypothetical protein